MAIVFSKNSGQNDGLWKETDRVLMAVMQDVDNEKNKDDELVKALFEVKKSKKFGEKVSALTTFGNFDIVDEGDSAVLDDMQEGFPKLIVHKQFMKKFVCTAEMAEDADLDAMKTASAAFIRSYKRSRAQFASNALTSQGGEFLYGSRNIDRTSGDGKALFATDHPGKKSGVAAQSNVFTNSFGTDATMLYTLANLGRNFLNDSGHPMGYTFDTIVVPGNTPQLEETVKRIIRSELVVGSSNNDVNTQKGLWNCVVDHWWVVPAGTAPYVLMSSDAKREMMGSLFFDRKGLEVRNEVNLDSHGLEWSGRCRFSAGFPNWRHVIMGGADAGSTIT